MSLTDAYRELLNQRLSYDPDDWNRQKLAIRYRQLGMRDSEARYRVATQLTGVPVRSFKDLTDSEAAALSELATTHLTELFSLYVDMTLEIERELRPSSTETNPFS